MFRIPSLGHHQAVSLYRGNYTIYGMIKYVNIKIIIIIIIIIILMFKNCIIPYIVQFPR